MTSRLGKRYLRLEISFFFFFSLQLKLTTEQSIITFNDCMGLGV